MSQKIPSLLIRCSEVHYLERRSWAKINLLASSSSVSHCPSQCFTSSWELGHFLTTLSPLLVYSLHCCPLKECWGEKLLGEVGRMGHLLFPSLTFSSGLGFEMTLSWPNSPSAPILLAHAF